MKKLCSVIENLRFARVFYYPLINVSKQLSVMIWLPNCFSTNHAMIRPLGDGFPTIRHTELYDLTASLLSEVCHNVTIEL